MRSPTRELSADCSGLVWVSIAACYVVRRSAAAEDGRKLCLTSILRIMLESFYAILSIFQVCAKSALYRMCAKHRRSTQLLRTCSGVGFIRSLAARNRRPSRLVCLAMAVK